jgi:ATP-dependent DNA helicase RecQ
VLQLKHDGLSVHGLGADQPTGYWRQLAERLIETGYLALSADEYRTAHLTEDSKPLLRGQVSVEVPMSRALDAKGRAPKAGKSRGVPTLEAHDEPLFEQLRNLRTRLARQQNVPPYVIFGDRALIEMAKQRPTNNQQFLQINGVGQSKLEQYGDAFMGVIRAIDT